MTGRPLVHPFAQQDKIEMAMLLAHMADAYSILEIGSCYGRALRFFGQWAGDGAIIRSIDLGVLPAEAGHLAGADISEYLRDIIEKIRKDGHDAEVLFADSHTQAAQDWATLQIGGEKYDFVFIDGDHSYEGVKKDWEAYGPMGRVVAFHDIANPNCGVQRFWREISQGRNTRSFVHSGMGIGLIYND